MSKKQKLLSIKKHHLVALCERLHLGTPIAEAQPVTGGLLHRVWRVKTTQGDFAVKQLNPGIAWQPRIRNRYFLTEQIASMMAAHGIPAVTALTSADGLIRDIDGISVIIFPWVDGAALSSGPAAPARARQIGEILGRMHALHLNIPELEIPTWRIFRDDDWVLLVRRGNAQQLPWAGRLRDMLRDIRWWSALAQEANKRLWSHLVVSHRDLNQKNVLWQDTRFAIINWEAAGLINPLVELIDCALAWSGQTIGEHSGASFRAVVAGYRSVGDMPRDSIYDALQSCLGNRLEWLEAHLRRSLNTSTPPDEQALAINETLKTLTTLQALAENISQWAAWIEH